MFILDSLFIGGSRFVLEKVGAMLLESQLAHENGEITDKELAERERRTRMRQ
jgi:hypothetical protein